MASEWVELRNDEADELIYVNLANASSIFTTITGGSAIWFLGGVGKDGRVHVKEPPKKVLALLNKIKSAKGT